MPPEPPAAPTTTVDPRDRFDLEQADLRLLAEPGEGGPAEQAAQLPQLFGWDELPGVVAVEVGESEATLIRAVPDGDGWSEGRVTETRPFRPWLLAADPYDRQTAIGALRSAQW